MLQCPFCAIQNDKIFTIIYFFLFFFKKKTFQEKANNNNNNNNNNQENNFYLFIFFLTGIFVILGVEMVDREVMQKLKDREERCKFIAS